MIQGKNYIGGEASAKGETVFTTFNPKTNSKNPWTFYEATPAEIDLAVEQASAAFEHYKNFSGKQKAAFLTAIAEEIETLGNTLLEVYTEESGLPEGRAQGERGRTLGQLKAFAALLEEGSWVEATIDTAQPERQPLPKVDLRKMLFPIGPVAVFGSSNFPLAFSTAGGDVASALAAGCPVIVKSHPMHAGTGELVASAVSKAAARTGMPKGIFSNLNSSGLAVGQHLVMHPKVKAVGFTGSIKGGTALYQMANTRPEPIPVFAEMGSVNPVVIFPSALQEKGAYWAAQYAGSITMGAGQFCTNPGLLLGIESKSLTEFIHTLGEEIAKINPICMLHPAIHDAFEKNKNELSEQQGVSVVAQYKADALPNHAKQKVVTVSGATFLNNPTLHKEVFGPFSVVVQCADSKELNAVLHRLEGQLTGTILGNAEDLETYKESMEALQGRVGRLIFNGVPTGVEVCPSMQHGGPFPATTDSRFSSVGVSSIKRWVRPVSLQNWPQDLLPDALKNDNPLNLTRIVNGEHTNAKI
jgi:NADP-dependent aldehyde dehydrogenase